MENYNNNINCECGKCHKVSIKEISVGDRVFDDFLVNLEKRKCKKILLVSDDDYDILEKICLEINKRKICFCKIVFKKIKASIMSSDLIDDYGQDLVIAVGGEELISVLKYYSYSLCCSIIIFAFNNFIDFTFSRFSRLYDGVLFNVYETQCPEEIYVPSQSFKYSILQSYYLASKHFAVFDNILEELIYNVGGCKRQKDFFKQTMNEYMKKKGDDDRCIWINNTWALIRIGLAMSFFGKTTGFYGGEYLFATLMQAQCKGADFLELMTVSQKLIINTYATFLNYPQAFQSVNLNKHIQKLSKLLKTSPTETLNRIVGAKFVLFDREIINRVQNYIPYLKEVFKKCSKSFFVITTSINEPLNVLKKYRFDGKRVENTFALTPVVSQKVTTLHLMACFGYMDKLFSE